MKRLPIRLGTLRTSVKPSSIVKASPQLDEGPLICNASLSRVCHVCTTQGVRYTCPRCNTPYCSVQCYRSHGEGCTEQFFESHVRSELKGSLNKGGNEDRKQQQNMQELLKRVRVFQDEQLQLVDEADDTEALMQRMQELALLDKSGQLTIDSLSEEEKKKFLSEVADGRLSKLVELWVPWWQMSERKYRSETSLRRCQLKLESIDSNHHVDEAVEEPLVLYPIGLFTNSDAKKMPQSMSALLPTGGQPSPLLRYNLVEMLSAYALMLRVFNGDYTQDPAEAAFMLLDLCRVLNEDARYETLEHVCLACLEKQSTAGLAANVLAIQDTEQILRTEVFLLDALSDMCTLLQRYQQDLKSCKETDKQMKREAKTAMKKLSAVQSKLRFYQIWAYVTPIEEFQTLAADLAVYRKDQDLFWTQRTIR